MVKKAVQYSFANHPIEVMRGLTPEELLGARWLARQAGFTGYGIVNTVTGPCELFILTRGEFNG